MPRTTGQRAGLSRDQVLAQAWSLVADAGPEGLTIRALAQRLDVVPNAVYRWFPDKAALIDAVLDNSLADITPDTARDTNTARDMDPPAAARAVESVLLACYDSYVAHPELAAVLLGRRRAPGPHSVRLREHIRNLLRACGLDDDDVSTAIPVLIVHTLGYAAFVAQARGADTELLSVAGAAAPRDTFVTGLRWLLDGIGVREG